MSSREERVARNEKGRRDVNLELEQISEEELHAQKFNAIEVLCECGRDSCFERIQLSIAKYDAVHTQRDRFVVFPGHEMLELERLVERNDGYLVVDKFGEAEEALKQS
jgi:hypothetical protein